MDLRGLMILRLDPQPLILPPPQIRSESMRTHIFRIEGAPADKSADMQHSTFMDRELMIREIHADKESPTLDHWNL
jgi:hypothetical protein